MSDAPKTAPKSSDQVIVAESPRSTSSSTELQRIWLVKANIAITGSTMVFFVAAPAIGYPLEYPQAFRIMQIIVPVFLGYLGAATRSVLGNNNEELEPNSQRPIVNLLVRGPVWTFVLGLVAALAAFGYTNRAAAPPGIGMSVDSLATVTCTLLGLLTATTSIINSKFFQGGA